MTVKGWRQGDNCCGASAIAAVKRKVGRKRRHTEREEREREREEREGKILSGIFLSALPVLQYYSFSSF